MADHAAAIPLQSKDHKTLMDVIDKLRSKGINRYVNLPQIVVCGDQSSGKSSVLQAISGMSFPTQDNLCTRFATELILRHTGEDAEEKCHISISPGADRSNQERARLEQFKYSEIPDSNNIGVLVDKAKEGLFRAGNKEQSAEDAAIVQSLVLSYMKNPRSIILAVVSAQSNFALQEVTQHAREIDIQGIRTIGLITKPDTLDFRLGWHVIRNRDFKSRNATNEERDKAELRFFDQGIWAGLPRSQKGAGSLRTRLSEVLKNQILDQLPDVLGEIQRGLEDCSSRLEKLGTARSSLGEQRKFLLNVSHQFSHLISEAKDGTYQDKFFGNAREEEGYEKRLRAIVQNTLSDFSDQMRINGKAREIVETSANRSRNQVLRSDYLQEVRRLMKRTRGCELLGTYNPLIIGELFHKQCAPWRGWLENYSEKIFGAVDFTVNAVLAHVVDEDTKVKLWGELINDALDQLNRQLQKRVNEVLRPHEDGHPITYNHYLTENVHKIRIGRVRKRLELGLNESGITSKKCPTNIDTVLDTLVKHTEADMETSASSDAIDWMEAYYQVALKQVVDDFSTLAIEASLISQLPGLFTPEIVFDLSDDVVSRIAGESWETADERRFITDKMEILRSGMVELQRLSKHRRCANDYEEAKADTPRPVTFESEQSSGQSTSGKYIEDETEEDEIEEDGIEQEELKEAIQVTAAEKEAIVEPSEVKLNEEFSGMEVDYPAAPREKGPWDDWGNLPIATKKKKKKGRSMTCDWTGMVEE
ncbi:P-loop containing nucleoside triphosphate hydrolase protein [Annulohypoxylon truncatum]|uniref:P-loop containing nucleoside triphosphate hydrolase protein n=1 Tax=Annulohypoxylon truncatum TaxID=327061 RepID=UPI00200818D9|nr:P-loop containing nucleoside triphosphate hydrolase protein [Annulohypoxylon truncatum]KAI1210261.1 P-loop containing nucleoside triphosphate hydrolase protein [Annulohypoxylon truncatum]